MDNNTLKYTGVVTLSKRVGTKTIELAKVHNEGKYYLFNFFSDCLIGDFDTAKINRPAKIMLLEKTTIKTHDGERYEYNGKSGFMHFTSIPEKAYDSDNNKSTVTYSFSITRDKLEGTSFNSIALYPEYTLIDDISEFSAICEINVDDIQSKLSTIGNSAVLVVDWQLVISNN